jgi:hypothetical protein
VNIRISSPANEKIKLVVQLQSKASARRKQKMFVVEGIRMYEEIPASELIATYVSETYYNEVIKAGKLSKEAKANLIKILPQTEAEFKDKSFTSERRKIYRSALKLYGAIAYNLQEKNKQLQAKCNQTCKNNPLTEEKVRSLLVKQKNNHQLELNKKNEIIKNLEDEIQALKSSPNFQPN